MGWFAIWLFITISYRNPEILSFQTHEKRESVRASKVFYVLSTLNWEKKIQTHLKVSFQIFIISTLTKGFIFNQLRAKKASDAIRKLCVSQVYPRKKVISLQKQLIIHWQKTTMLKPLKASLLQRVGNLTPFPIAGCNKAPKIIKQLPDT